MTWFEWAEALSYAVTVVGLPLAIAVFMYEQRRNRQNEEEEIYQRLSDEYTEFLKLVLANPDLQFTQAHERRTADRRAKGTQVRHFQHSHFPVRASLSAGV